MSRFWRLSSNERGSGFETLAIAASVLALASVAATSALERYAQVGGFPTIASVDSQSAPLLGAGGKAPVFNGIDLSATGSINRPIVLEPCTGKQKN